MRESKIEKAVCDYAKTWGWVNFKFSSPGQRAVPDRIFMKDGFTFFIEFKATGKTLTKLQERMATKFNLNGFAVHEIDNIEYGIRLIDYYISNPRGKYHAKKIQPT